MAADSHAFGKGPTLLRKAERPIVEPKPYKTEVKEKGSRITLRGRDGKLVVDAATGTVVQYRVKGRNVFLKDFGLKPNFWTAPNDNEWGNFGPLTRYADWKNSLSVLDVSVDTDEFGSAVHVTYGLPYGCSMEVAYNLLTNHPEMTIADVAREVGFTAPNLREQFKRCYGITPAEYRAGLTATDEE